MRPSQRSMGTSSASEWYICLTEAEHQHYQQHQHLQQRPFERHQQQKPRLHNDAISALNYLIYVGSTSTSSETISPNTLNDSTLYLYSFILIPTGSNTWAKYHRRAGYVELEPASGQPSVPPTSEWGSTATLSFIREASFQASHIIDFNLASSPQHVHITSIINTVQHPNIRQRLRNWLHQFRQSVYAELLDFNRQLAQQVVSGFNSIKHHDISWCNDSSDNRTSG